MNNHDSYNGVPLPTRSAALQSEKRMSYKRASKKEPYASIQALHGVAFHSEDAAVYPQSPANGVAPASNDFKC